MHAREYWDRLATTYDSLYQSPWSRYEDSLTQRTLTREYRIAGGTQVLDLGCGSGLGFRLLKSQFPELSYTGIDFSPRMLSELLRRHPGATTNCGNVVAVMSSIKVRSFDLIIAINTSASFFDEPKEVMRQISRLLKPTGRYSLSFLNKSSLRRVLHNLRDDRESYRTRGDHDASISGVNALVYEPSQLVGMAKDVNLVVSSIEYQSVLGGVLEHRFTIPLEKVLMRVRPRLGHSVSISGSLGCAR